jgi:hypothetical protein
VGHGERLRPRLPRRRQLAALGQCPLDLSRPLDRIRAAERPV